MKDMIKRIREEREGFTLAELLIVVAIIAVLVAIAIPVFNSQLEKSRDAVTVSNLRAAYAEAQVAVLSGEGDDANHVTYTKNADNTMKVEVAQVVSKGTIDGWTGDVATDLPFPSANITALGAKASMGGTPKNDWTVTFTYSAAGALTSVEAK